MIHFRLDARQIAALQRDLGLTERQTKAALSRALRRVAATLRKRAERQLKGELDTRKIAFLRQRLKSVRLTRKGIDGIKLWFGENDMAVSGLRGSIRKTKSGAKFAGKAGAKEFPKGFVEKSKFGRTIMFRKGSARLPIEEAKIPVKTQMDALIDGPMFADTLELVWKYFQADMMARSKFGVGSAR